MKGRKTKPVSVKIAEGSRIRNDRINREAPVPPTGAILPPAPLSPAEKAIWDYTLDRAAPGQIRPLDGVLLWRYCKSVARLISAEAQYESWCNVALGSKEPGESDLLRKAANGILGGHPILSVINSLVAQIAQCEKVLGLSPVDREHIKAPTQGELPLENDPWNSFDAPTKPTTQ